MWKTLICPPLFYKYMSLNENPFNLDIRLQYSFSVDILPSYMQVKCLLFDSDIYNQFELPQFTDLTTPSHKKLQLLSVLFLVSPHCPCIIYFIM